MGGGGVWGEETKQTLERMLGNFNGDTRNDWTGRSEYPKALRFRGRLRKMDAGKV